MFSGALSLGREAVSGYQLFSANAVAAGDWIHENTDRDDVFLTGQQHINPVCSLAGRQIICGSDLYVFFHGWIMPSSRRIAGAFTKTRGKMQTC